MKKIVVRKGLINAAQLNELIKADASLTPLLANGGQSTISTVVEFGSADVTYAPTELSDASNQGAYAEDSAILSELISLSATVPTIESATISDILSKDVGISTTDNLGTSESIAIFVDSRLIDEMAVSSEVFTSAFTKYLEDQLANSDVVTIQLDSLLTEPLSISEYVFIVSGKSLDDTTTLSEYTALSLNAYVPSESTSTADEVYSLLDSILPTESISQVDSLYINANKFSDDLLNPTEVLALLADKNVADETQSTNETIILQADLSIYENTTASEVVEKIFDLSLFETVSISDDVVGMVVVEYRPSDDSMTVAESIGIMLSPYIEDIQSISDLVLTTADKLLDETSVSSEVGYIVKQNYFLSEYTVGHRYTGTITNF